MLTVNLKLDFLVCDSEFLVHESFPQVNLMICAGKKAGHTLDLALDRNVLRIENTNIILSVLSINQYWSNCPMIKGEKFPLLYRRKAYLKALNSRATLKLKWWNSEMRANSYVTVAPVSSCEQIHVHRLHLSWSSELYRNLQSGHTHSRNRFSSHLILRKCVYENLVKGSCGLMLIVDLLCFRMSLSLL